jgi:P2 family phage contractile tail tube protein
MAFPQILRNFNLYVDGSSYAGKVDELTPPKLSIKTEEFRAAGLDAPIQVDLGMEKLECSWSMAEYNADVFALFGLLGSDPVQIVFRGALQRQGEDAVALRITVRGTVKETDPGTWKVGDKPAGSKFTAACVYYAMEIDGEQIIEIDVENMTRVINGTDEMQSLRAALGI